MILRIFLLVEEASSSLILHTLNIYRTEGIDFIFPQVNFDDIEEVILANASLKEFTKRQHYLHVHFLFFLNYMSAKFDQILCILSASKIKITLVSLKPGELTINRYMGVCSDLNLDSYLDMSEIQEIVRRPFIDASFDD